MEARLRVLRSKPWSRAGVDAYAREPDEPSLLDGHEA
jgi:hypothetical protein